MSRRFARLGSSALLASALAAGCGLPSLPVPEEDAGPKPSPCKLGFLGDPSLEPELEIIALGPDYTSTRVDDGGTIALMLPPQGGRVIFVGVRARNVDACAARLTGALRDPATQKIMVDARTVNLKDRGDGYAASTDSDISTFSNVPICPNQWSSQSAFGIEYQLEMSLQERDGRTTQKSLRVTLDCAEPENEAQCKCICKEGYVLGEQCGPDAGAPPPDGGPP